MRRPRARRDGTSPFFSPAVPHPLVIALIVSRADPASVNIRDRLLELASWENAGDVEGIPMRRYMDVVMAEVEGLHLEVDNLDRLVARAAQQVPEAVLVASKHRAQSGAQSMTVHPIGNYGAAEFGGKPQRLVPAPARLMANALRFLAEEAAAAKVPHAVTYEATHHGPYLETPTAYIEIGTSEGDWSNPVNGKVVAQAILRLAEVPEDFEGPVLVGVGGSHYAPRATDLARKKECAFGHLIPTYQLQTPGGLPLDLVRQAVEGTRPRPDGYYLDDRNLKGEEAAVVKFLEDMGLKRYHESDLRDRS